MNYDNNASTFHKSIDSDVLLHCVILQFILHINFSIDSHTLCMLAKYFYLIIRSDKSTTNFLHFPLSFTVSFHSL